jgi:general secretion pathway protein B
MSYILEALKKSQQDRELGRVPTLATQPLLTNRDGGGNSWIAIALGLAGLAVAIALYAVLRAGPEMAPGISTPTSVQIPAQNPTQPLASANPPPTAASVQATTQVIGQSPVQSHPQPLPQAPTMAPASVGTLSTPEGAVNFPVAQVPAGSGAAAVPAAAVPMDSATAPPLAPQPSAMPPASPPSGTTVVASAEPQPKDHPLVATAPAIRHAPATDIPDDLRQDIEAFKEQIKEGRGGKSPSKASTRQEVPLRESRLPKEVQERLPSFLLTVHLYDADPAKRLVIIDGRRLRQGDTTRSGILVEEIFPDGVALAFDGHRFFQPR